VAVHISITVHAEAIATHIGKLDFELDLPDKGTLRSSMPRWFFVAPAGSTSGRCLRQQGVEKNWAPLPDRA